MTVGESVSSLQRPAFLSLAALRPARPRFAGSAARVEFLLLDALIAAVIVAEYGYVVVFNLVPDEVRLGIAAALFGAQAVLAVWALAARPAMWSAAVAAALGVKLSCWAISILTGAANPVEAAELVRIITREAVPYVAAIWLLSWSNRLPFRLVAVAGCMSFGICAVWAIAGEPIVIMGEQRLAAVTGGENELGLHPSAYFMVLTFFIFERLRVTNRLSGAVAWPVLAAALVLVGLYDVRTTFVMLAAVALGHLWQTRLRRLLLEASQAAAALTLVAAAGMLLVSGPGDIDAWGSGRVGSYAFRIDMLKQRDLLSLLVGTGPGSDVMVTPVWWWEAHDSHSDLFTALIETGVIGVLGLILYFRSLWAVLGPENRPFLLAMIASSAISNGLLVRPTEFFLMALAMAAAETGLRARPLRPLRIPLPRFRPLREPFGAAVRLPGQGRLLPAPGRRQNASWITAGRRAFGKLPPPDEMPLTGGVSAERGQWGRRGSPRGGR